MLQRIALCLTLCLLTCHGAGAQDRSTPEATVRSFLAAVGRGDTNQMAACVKGAQLGGPALNALAQQIKKDPASFTLSSAKATQNGNSAVVTGQVAMTSGPSQKAQTYATQVNLGASGGSWQIVPDAAKAKLSGQPDVVNMLAYVLTDAKVFTEARGRARQISCLSNIKQISLGALMFLQDNDEVFKLKAAAYKKSLISYIKNDALFKCPADTGSGTSYSFNAGLVGVSLAKIHSPAGTVMVYEGKNGQLDLRHEGKAAVGFVDGHARLVNADGAKKLRWKP